MSPVRVREARVGDVQAILDIYNDAVLHTTASYDLEPQAFDVRLAWFEARRAVGDPVFVAEDEGRVVGWSAYGPFRQKPGYRYTVEHSVYVASDRRGRGVGSALLPPLVQHARNRGMHVMIAGVDASSEASVRFHERFGFERVAHFRQVGFKFGRWLDLVFLQLMLSGE